MQIKSLIEKHYRDSVRFKSYQSSIENLDMRFINHTMFIRLYNFFDTAIQKYKNSCN